MKRRIIDLMRKNKRGIFTLFGKTMSILNDNCEWEVLQDLFFLTDFGRLLIFAAARRKRSSAVMLEFCIRHIIQLFKTWPNRYDRSFIKVEAK